MTEAARTGWEVSDSSDDMEVLSGFVEGETHDDRAVLVFTLKLLKTIARDVSQDACEPLFWKSLVKQIEFIENHLEDEL